MTPETGRTFGCFMLSDTTTNWSETETKKAEVRSMLHLLNRKSSWYGWQ